MERDDGPLLRGSGMLAADYTRFVAEDEDPTEEAPPHNAAAEPHMQPPTVWARLAALARRLRALAPAAGRRRDTA
jgi:hypothetical protein